MKRHQTIHDNYRLLTNFLQLVTFTGLNPIAEGQSDHLDHSVFSILDLESRGCGSVMFHGVCSSEERTVSTIFNSVYNDNSSKLVIFAYIRKVECRNVCQGVKKHRQVPINVHGSPTRAISTHVLVGLLYLVYMVQC